MYEPDSLSKTGEQSPLAACLLKRRCRTTTGADRVTYGERTNMTTKHTPGPWNIEAVKDYMRPHDSGIDTGDAEALANARLIAAAPDLLSTVKQLLPFALEHYRKSSEGAGAIHNARKVIEAVEGGAK